MTPAARVIFAFLAVALAVASGVLVGEIGDSAAIAIVLLGITILAATARVAWRTRTAEPELSDEGHLTPAPPWWLKPAWLVPLAGLPSLLLAYSISPSVFRADWNTPKYFDETHLALGITMLGGFLAGALVTRLWWGAPAQVTDTLTRLQLGRLRFAVRLLLVLSLLGYGLQLIFAASRGLDVTEVTAVFTGETPVGDVKREFLRPVTGVTTLTQFGPLTVVGLALLRRLDRAFPANRWIATLILLATLRSVLYAERLALLELLLPLAVISLAFPRTDRYKRTPLRKWAVAIAPVWIPVALFLVFGASEYVRSWSSYYAEANPGRSYAGFVLDRVGAYYATASNNSALLFERDPRPAQVPYQTVEWFWNFPVLDRVVPYERVAGVDFPEAFESLLVRLANPEFNNPGGILLPAFDLGPLGGLVVWVLLGILLTVAYTRFIAVRASGLVIFPVLVIGCLEVGRLLYWSLGRAFPAIAGALVLGLWLDRGARAAEPVVSRPGAPAPRGAVPQTPPT